MGMAEPLVNIGTPITGIKELSQLTSAAGTAHSSSTVITLDDEAVVDQWENFGIPVHRLRGDGRAWFKVLSAPPVSPVAGDLWLEDLGGGDVVLRFYDGAGEVSVASSDPALSIVASAALLQAHAVRALIGGMAHAAAVVDVAKQYRVIGILADDVAMGDAGKVITDGGTLTMADWSLLTGAAALTIGAVYWLSVTPGRYTTTPVAAVGARVGRAVGTDTLLVDTGLVVVG